MSLSPAQQQKAQQWLGQKVTQPCACGSRAFSLGMIISAPEHADGGMSIGGQAVPMLQVICNTCARVHLFAAVPMGLVS